MKCSAKKGLAIALIFVVTAVLLLGANLIAIEYCAGNLALFTVVLLIVPMAIVAAAAMLLGMQIKWTWIKGGCIALALMLLSAGVGGLTTALMKDAVSSVAPQDELMGELYEELDEQAYAYMLEQGLIGQGDEIYAGQGDGAGELRSEMYVGIQQSDPATELIGNVVTFLIAFGACFAGAKIKWENPYAKG